MKTKNTNISRHKKIRIIIADEQSLFRQGLTHVLAGNDDLEIVGEFTSSEDLLASLNNLYPDIVIMDTGLPPNGGLETTRNIKKLLPSIAVILLAQDISEDGLFEAIRSRASAYLSRKVAMEELIDNIFRSAAGEHPINDTLLAQPKVATKLLEQFQDLSWGKGAESFISPLTPRETEILNYMAKGYLNKQIANALSISEQTIKNHITSILRKLDANARTQAVIIAVKRGLISLS